MVEFDPPILLSNLRHVTEHYLRYVTEHCLRHVTKHYLRMKKYKK
jgi:hypothetical protein